MNVGLCICKDLAAWPFRGGVDLGLTNELGGAVVLLGLSSGEMNNLNYLNDRRIMYGPL